MLKYQLNISSLKSDLIPIPLADYSVDELYGEDYKNQKLLTCYSENEISFNEGTRIVSMYEQVMINDDFLASTAYDFKTVYYPTAVNQENRSFSITIDKYFDLRPSRTSIYIDKTPEVTENNEEITETVTEEKPKDWWYITFEGSHLFDVTNGEVYKLYITYNTPNGFPDVIEDEYEDNLPDGLEILYVSNEAGKEIDEVETNAEVVTSSTIRVPYSVLEDNKPLYNAIFYTEDNVEKSNIFSVRFFRDNFLFDDGTFNLYLDLPMTSVTIPLEQEFATDLYMDDGIRENFTEDEMKKCINKITEMEKDIYYPVIWKSDSNSDNYGSVLHEVNEIRFNLHFRTHRGNDWIADADSYWNGVRVLPDGNPEFIVGVSHKVDEYGNTSEEGVSYFNKGYINRKEQQSDLLGYLNFSNKDVRYQKNKLKKSFLRVMFYDSTNPTNQNLLAYSTIFMDSGAYFSKYARYIQSEGYMRIDKDPDNNAEKEYDVRTDLTGIKVDREPTLNRKKQKLSDKSTIEDIEEVRLSTQFVVRDKYSSDASSEGFYLYLWKDNFLGTYPQDIYMKVEFNHAGYGRTIPFMCPFKDENGQNGFKTFDNILKDWTTDPNKEDKVVGYGIRKYLKYSYIHFKYKYDKETERHVYYLDDEFYGSMKKTGVYFTDNAITINLYEAKII